MIRPMELTDIPRAAEICVFGWRCAYRGIVPDDFLFNRLSVPRQMATLENDLYNKKGESYVYDDGIVKGVISFGKSGDENKPDSFELWWIYVEPLMKRQGIGRKLAEFCAQKAVERGLKEICLWVFEENESSRRFYEQLGYRPDGKKNWRERNSAYEVRYVKEI